MPCYHPVDAWAHRTLKTLAGKTLVSFAPTAAFRADAMRIKVSCRQCVGCKLKRSSEWATRCVHEAQLHTSNCFLTLTFNDDHVPRDFSLDKKHMQDFNKRLRERFMPKCPYPVCKCKPRKDCGCELRELRQAWLREHSIRTYYCGEYGSQYGRPHYHGIYFNFDFDDKYLWRVTKQGHHVWRSPTLEKLWPFGNSEIGSVTFNSAAYVARYICEKLTVPHARSSPEDIKKFHDHYDYVLPDTGEVITRPQEFVEMSRAWGIGKYWFDQYHADVFPGDFVVIEGRKLPPPRYYDRQFELSHPMDFDLVKYERFLDASRNSDDNTPERLAVREEVKLAQISQLKRTLGASNVT